MAHKSKTLELANALEKNGDGCTCCAYASFECCCNAVWGSDYTREAAAEIRRLHEENVYLRDVYVSLVKDRGELFDELQKAEAENERLRGDLTRDGYRKCADGQRTTQFCGLLDAAVKAEREACAKVCDARVIGDHNREDQEAKRCAEAIRARGEQEQPK